MHPRENIGYFVIEFFSIIVNTYLAALASKESEIVSGRLRNER